MIQALVGITDLEQIITNNQVIAIEAQRGPRSHSWEEEKWVGFTPKAV